MEWKLFLRYTKKPGLQFVIATRRTLQTTCPILLCCVQCEFRLQALSEASCKAT